MNISQTIQIDIKKDTQQVRDVRRCLQVLYTTPVGTLALDRDFGIDWSFLDRPMEVAKAMITTEIIAKTKKYESRAVIREVSWDGYAAEGYLVPKVVIDVE